MARKKVKMAWISNDGARRNTLKKRRQGLMKKVMELSVLCGVDAAAVIYVPQERQPEVWPPAPAEAAAVIERFRSMPEMEQSRKRVSQEDFLRLRAVKLHDQLRRAERENREMEMSVLMHEGMGGRSFSDLSIEVATRLAWMLEERVKVVYAMMEEAKKQTAAAAGRRAMEQAMEALQRPSWLAEMSPWLEEPPLPYMDPSSPWHAGFSPFN